MKCPVCKDVTLLMSEKHGIEIDYCPECRGIWLDRGELDKIVQRTQKDLSDDDDDRSSRRDYDRDDRKSKDRDYDRNYDRSYDHGYDRDYDRNYRQKPKKRKSAMLGDLLEILEAKIKGGCQSLWRSVRPIPQTDYFFENQWKAYRERISCNTKNGRLGQLS